MADDILILSSARILEQLQKHRTIVPVEIFTLAKSKDPPSDALPRFLAVFTSNQRIGSLSKETYAGKLIDEWNNALAASEKKPEVVDIASAISTFMSVKDDEELVRRLSKHQHLRGSDVHSVLKKVTRTAANLTVTLLTHYVAVKLETILDRETKISHDQFATQIEARLGSGEGESAKGPDMKVWGKGRGINDVGGTMSRPYFRPTFPQVDWLSTEFCYSPIIQSRSSGGGYDLKPTAESSPDDMSHKGVFLVSLGMRYKGYCANLGRTFIVDPDKVGFPVHFILCGSQLFCRSKSRSTIYCSISKRRFYRG